MNIWKVIQNGNSLKRTGRDHDRRVIILPPMTADKHIDVQRESKARTNLLQSIPDDHVTDFHYMDDARDIWNAIKARFGGNANSKKMRKSMQKQEFSEFRIGEEEGLHKGYDKMQKFLTLTLKTKCGLKLLSFDDLYYKLKTLNVDVKGYTTFSSSQSAGSSHSTFVSTTSGSKKMSYRDSPSYSLTTTYTAPSNFKTGSHRSDLEEMDLKWQMAMLSIRVHKFKKKARRKIDFDKKESARFNKKKVKCYKCQQKGHFARECRAKGGNDKHRYSSFKIKDIGKKEEDLKALIIVDTLVDWTDHDGKSDGVIASKEFGMIAGCDTKVAIEEGAAKIYNLITGADTEEASTACDAGEFALMGVTFEAKLDNHLVQIKKWRISSKNLFRLIKSSMSIRTKVGLGFNNYIRENELGCDDSGFSVFTTNSEDVEVRPLFNRFAKADNMKDVPPPLSGDYTSLSDHIDLDESHMSYGIKSSTSSDSKSVSNDFVSCDDSDKSSEVNTNDFASSDSSDKSLEPKPNDSTSCASTSSDLPSFYFNSFDKNENTSRTSCNKNGYFNKKAGPVRSRNKVNHQNQFVPQAVLLRTGKVNIPPARLQPVPTGKPKVFAPVPTGRQNRPFPVPTDKGYSPSVIFGWTLKRTGPVLEEPSSKRQKFTEAPIPSVPEVPPSPVVVSNEDSEDEAPLLWSALFGLEVITTPLGDINALYRIDRSTAYFTTLREILYMVDRQDLLTLYGLVVKYYENHPVASARLISYVVPTGRVVVRTGRYVVLAGNVIIVSSGRLSLIPTGRVLSPANADLGFTTTKGTHGLRKDRPKKTKLLLIDGRSTYYGKILRAPTEGYAEAIVVSPILAEHFELKHSLINMMISDQFLGLERDNPHDHIRAVHRWLEKEPPRSILTWEDLAWDRYKDLLRACPRHGFTKLHQLDTFYNALKPADQDSLNSVADGNLLERRTQDVLTIIENKSKVRSSQNKSIVSQVKSSDANSSSSSEIAKLTHAVNQQTSAVTTVMTTIHKQFQANPPPASIKSVKEICVTCDSAHLYYQCLTADGNTFLEFRDNIRGYVLAAVVNYNQGNPGYRPSSVANQIRPSSFAQPNVQNNQNRFSQPQGYNQGKNFNQDTSYQAPIQQNQVVPLRWLEKTKKMNEINIKAMQTQINNVKNKLRNEMKTLIQASMSKQTNELKNMMASFFQMNTASTSGSGPLPSNTIANPKGNLKAITTRSGLVLDGPFVLMPPPFINSEEDERAEETLTDPKLAEKCLKALLSNKEKLLERENTPLNENCSAVSLKKLPEKLGDHRKFLIPCGFSELKCKALADLGASINLMPLSAWKKLGINDLPFDIKSDLREIEYLLNHDPTKEVNSILKDSIDEGNLVDPNNDLVDTIPEMFTDEHTLDYSSPPLYDDVDDDLVELESDIDDAYDDPFNSKEDKINESKLLIDELDPPRSSDFLSSSKCDLVLYEDFFKVDAFPSTNNEDKELNPGILIHENLDEVTNHVAPDKNVKKISISNASLFLRILLFLIMNFLSTKKFSGLKLYSHSHPKIRKSFQSRDSQEFILLFS
uniref:CCHC-type domain-containing protein n=1 Tax=Tanacetum cinerariifolium TaxID=118510 RepID=A0A6L2LLH3_TANCI|nr:hypothetical protein [Tanacetum cinerariifolium]